jgi:hypothetical protein
LGMAQDQYANMSATSGGNSASFGADGLFVWTRTTASKIFGALDWLGPTGAPNSHQGRAGKELFIFPANLQKQNKFTIKWNTAYNLIFTLLLKN